MKRNTDLATILFPVELRPVGYMPSAVVSGDKPEHNEEAVEFESINQYKAVVSSDTGAIFAVVSKRMLQERVAEQSRVLLVEAGSNGKPLETLLSN